MKNYVITKYRFVNFENELLSSFGSVVCQFQVGILAQEAPRKMIPFGGPPGFPSIMNIPPNTAQAPYLQPQVLMPPIQRSNPMITVNAPQQIQMNATSSPSPIAGAPRPMLVPPQMAAEIAAANASIHRSPSTGSVWSEHTASDGRIYYYNKITKQSSWLKPDELKTPEEKKAASLKLWREYKTPEGRPYYYNVETKETTWICPKDFEPSNKEEKKENTESKIATIPKEEMTTNPKTDIIEAVGEDEVDEEKELKKKQADKFRELLRDKYNEGKITSTSSWDNTVKYIQHDPRFRILNKVSEKKQLFNAWKVQRQKEERDEKRIAIKKAKEELEQWLQNHPKVRATMRYSKAESLFANEPEWKAVHDSERKEIFRDAMELIEKREKENAKSIRRRNVQALADILEGMEEITYKTTWAQAQRLLIENPAFANDSTLQSMDKEDALIVFEEHIRTAEKHYLKEKDLEEKRRRRQERKIREAFQAFLVELHKRGELTSMSLWSELYPIISSDARFDNMLEQSGSTPLDLFKFYVEDLKSQFGQDRKIIKEILKDRNVTVTLDTTFDQLCRWVSSDERGKNVDPGNMKLCYNSLMEKAENKEKEQEREEARRRRRQEAAFRKVLNSLLPPVEPSSEWAVIRPKIENEEAFLAVESEQLREKFFYDYVANLTEVCGHYHGSAKKKKKDKKKRKNKDEKEGLKSQKGSGISQISEAQEKEETIKIGIKNEASPRKSKMKFVSPNVLSSQYRSITMSKQTKLPLGIDSKKVSGELFTLTYGALVAELLKDLENPAEVNRQLDKMGYNIGLRLADDLLAKNPQIGRCTDMHQVADILSKVALRTYLGVTAHITNWSAGNDEFSIILDSNPLTEFVEVPSELAQDLRYSQMICGAIRGALEMMHLEVQAAIVQEFNQNTEIRVKFIRILHESMPPGEED
ncbi:unnamed protein product [Dracunculus medinensis]|uniref:WW domain-containing protein n=1 Tax=Dracunculus medinensis TaxID=318479 RepID=A0A158Q3R6_DRAME|nr:unnamed protein product [Dracunculus medinensis]